MKDYLLNGKPASEQDLLDKAREYDYRADYFTDFVIDILEDNGNEVEYIGEEETDNSMTNIAWVLLFLLMPFLGMSQTTYTSLSPSVLSPSENYMIAQVDEVHSLCLFDIETITISEGSQEDFIWAQFGKGDLYGISLAFLRVGRCRFSDQVYFKGVNSQGELRLRMKDGLVQSGFIKIFLTETCSTLIVEFVVR